MHSPLIVFTALLGTLSITAAAPTTSTLDNRGIGSLACNVARIKIVAALASTRSAVGDVQDQTVQDGANAGLDTAKTGIANIAKSIISGSAPATTDREMVEAGITAAITALGGANSTSTDPAVTKAQSKLADASQAGRDVVAECK